MNKILKKLIKRTVLKTLMRRGYPYQTAIVAVKEIEEDIVQVKDVNIFKKIALYRKGYYSERLKCYRISKENKLEYYMPEIRYYKLHPINGFYSKWIDDKLTMRYIFDSYNSYLPGYYYQIRSGKIIRLIDCPEKYTTDINGILDLLRDRKNLAVKLTSGSRRQGFFKFTYTNDVYSVNDKEITEPELKKIVEVLDDYLITEFLVPYEEFNKIYPDISNPVRVIVIHDENGIRFPASFVRFGMNDVRFSGNLSPEGIYAGIDINDGALFGPCMYDKELNLVGTIMHPDTGVEISGKLKNWDMMKTVLTQFCNDFPQLCYMGFDIIFTDEGFKIIEINSLPGLQHIQCYYPMLKDEDNLAFFRKLFQAKNMKL